VLLRDHRHTAQHFYETTNKIAILLRTQRILSRNANTNVVLWVRYQRESPGLGPHISLRNVDRLNGYSPILGRPMIPEKSNNLVSIFSGLPLLLAKVRMAYEVQHLVIRNQLHPVYVIKGVGW